MAATFYDLDTPLIELAGAAWTIRNAVEGVQIFGGIGSGKTSGSGRFIALKYLNAGFGGLVLTAKPDEKETWEEYCRQTNRQDDLVILSPEHENHFNFLEYESTSTDGRKSFVENIVQVLKTVIRASEAKAGTRNDDPFWEDSLDMLMLNIVELCLIAYGKVSVQLLYDIAQTLPKKDAPKSEGEKLNAFAKASSTASNNITRQVLHYEESLTEEQRILLTESPSYEEDLCEILPDARALKFVDQFFLESFFNLSDKTRSIIDFSFSGFLFSLLREPVFSLFCQHPSTVTPEDCLNGKIILVDLPVKRYHKVGRNCQILFKYIWQRAMEKRQIKKNDRPVFLWADEAQHFLHEYDADYQATARSSRIATVYISQNLPNYYANMGGDKSNYRVKSFLGTLGTKIFHSNADIETNRYASELIGDAYFEDTSKTAAMAGNMSLSRTRNIKLDKLIRPEDFAKLKNGGPLNSFKVEGYMHLQSHLLNGETNYLKMKFDQNYIPHPNSTS
ncbi:MAG: TraM recognition domain-containing protein [Williamsia sp.]|nr:TraM recognition domain-containing protein [Williamsia sp.]